MDSRVGFAKLAGDSTTREVIESLGVGEVYSPENLGRLIRYFGQVAQTNGVITNWQFFSEFYKLFSQLTWLVKFRDATRDLLESPKLSATTGEGLLAMRIIDYDNTGIEPERIEGFFRSLIEIHSQLSIYLNERDSRLRVIYVDSGSDLVVGLQCAKAVLDIIKGLLSEFWEKWSYTPFNDFDRKIASLEKGMSFVAGVNDKVKQGLLSEEDARNVTLRVMREVTNLASIGVSLPQEEIVITIDQRKVLKEVREIKLLGDGGDRETAGRDRLASDGSHDGDDENTPSA